ncbi:PCDA1 protein, partial [Rhabdornis inornatus]|nr:PCDA1 protein [Rhabdornis inornatus]
DADIGANAQLSYTLSPSEHFRIEEENSNSRSKSLFLILMKSLDRETTPVHRLVLTASDGGRPSLTGTMELVISVLDVNDNAPQFNQSVYNVLLPEDALRRTLVARVNATDSDTGTYGEVIYEIDTIIPPPAADIFSIDAISGEIRLTGTLDFEAVTLYELHIKGADKGTPPLTGHCKVVLEVLDVNDNAPEVWVTSLSVPVSEDAIAEFTTLPGSRFPLEGASDADIGANAQLSYTLSPSEHFTLDVKSSDENRKSLFLVLVKSLDRETIPVHQLLLTASDGGRPSLTGTMELVISVLDTNDNAPQFNQSVYKVQLPENATVGSLVARVNATDPDEGSNKEFSYS